MTWLAPLAALLGVLLGAGASAITDKRRWKHEERTRTREQRVVLYTDYLSALENTGQALLTVLRTTSTHERPAAVKAAFTEHGLAAVRHRIHILAPAPVSDAADAVFRALRNSQHFVETADPQDEATLGNLKAEIGSLRDLLKTAMRHDIATSN
ncbi:hypothetical protein ACFQL8_24300 [Streptomyces goshikiensis]|uniref:hypothetical protein n=1 Tax=Streptomyces goshikiensis TaxID=1942 RepID=UPI0033182CBA